MIQTQLFVLFCFEGDQFPLLNLLKHFLTSFNLQLACIKV